jgi:hypothetical protein
LSAGFFTSDKTYFQRIKSIRHWHCTWRIGGSQKGEKGYSVCIRTREHSWPAGGKAAVRTRFH